MPSRYNWMADTSETAFRELVELQRRMSPGEKLMKALELSDLLMKLSEAGVRRMYPEAGDREVFLRAAARKLGRDLVIRVYGWDPDGGEKP